jgi:hypothetical protein
MNPQIYPEWWGIEDNNSSPSAKMGRKGSRFVLPKRLKSADPAKAKINKAIARHCEDSLDKRLRMVHEKEENRANHSSSRNSKNREPALMMSRQNYSNGQP